MTGSQSKDTWSLFPNENEAVALEAAVRTAVLSIVKAFLEVSEERARCYQTKLAEVEKEKTKLKLQLKAAEQELQALRHFSPASCSSSSFSSSSSVRFGVSSAGVTFSPEVTKSTLDREEEEREEETPVGPSLSLFKQESSHEDAIYIKIETPEDSFPVDCGLHGDSMGSGQCGQLQQRPVSVQSCGTCNSLSHAVEDDGDDGDDGGDDAALSSLERKRLTSMERVRRYRARIRADPERYHVWKEKNRLRYLRRRTSIQDLSEPMKKAKRKAWREATRRHRARKLAQAALAATHLMCDQDVVL